jgi:hypothetical protein
MKPFAPSGAPPPDPVALSVAAPEAPRSRRARSRRANAVPRFWPGHRTGILLACVTLAAVLVTLGGLHRLEHADAIVPVLVSLQRWTPFYWDQERYGMLVPLVAIPVRDPLWNLLAQRFLLALAGLGAVVLLARHVLAGRDWPLAGALAAGALLVAAPAPWLFEYLFDQPYGLSIALAASGLALADPLPDGRRHAGRVTAGGLLVVAAHWVNAATGMLLLPLAVARAAVDRIEGEGESARARLGWDAGLLAAGLAAGQVALRAYMVLAERPARLDVSPLALAALPAAWTAFLGNAWRDAGGWPAVLACAAAAGVALLALAPLRAHLPGAALRAGALLAAALAYALFAGSLRWVAENAFHWRYLAPAAVLVHLAAFSLLAEALARLRRVARPAALAALALLPAAALAAAGAPSLARVRADLDRAAGRLTEDVLAARCDVVAGDYWSVWPAVFHATLVLHEGGDARRVWGVSHRTNPTVAQWWDRRAALRICRPLGEEAQAERWLRAFHLWPVRAVERRGAVDVLVTAPAAP